MVYPLTSTSALTERPPPPRTPLSKMVLKETVDADGRVWSRFVPTERRVSQSQLDYSYLCYGRVFPADPPQRLLIQRCTNPLTLPCHFFRSSIKDIDYQSTDQEEHLTGGIVFGMTFVPKTDPRYPVLKDWKSGIVNTVRHTCDGMRIHEAETKHKAYPPIWDHVPIDEYAKGVQYDYEVFDALGLDPQETREKAIPIPPGIDKAFFRMEFPPPGLEPGSRLYVAYQDIYEAWKKNRGHEFQLKFAPPPPGYAPSNAPLTPEDTTPSPLTLDFLAAQVSRPTCENRDYEGSSSFFDVTQIDPVLLVFPSIRAVQQLYGENFGLWYYAQLRLGRKESVRCASEQEALFMQVVYIDQRVRWRISEEEQVRYAAIQKEEDEQKRAEAERRRAEDAARRAEEKRLEEERAEARRIAEEEARLRRLEEDPESMGFRRQPPRLDYFSMSAEELINEHDVKVHRYTPNSFPHYIKLPKDYHLHRQFWLYDELVEVVIEDAKGRPVQRVSRIDQLRWYCHLIQPLAVREPYIATMTAMFDCVSPRMAAIRMLHAHLDSYWDRGRVPHWHTVHGGPRDYIRDSSNVDPSRAGILFLDGLSAMSSWEKIEKAVDILNMYSHCPRIIVGYGLDPLSMGDLLGVALQAGFYFRSRSNALGVLPDNTAKFVRM